MMSKFLVVALVIAMSCRADSFYVSGRTSLRSSMLTMKMSRNFKTAFATAAMTFGLTLDISGKNHMISLTPTAVHARGLLMHLLITTMLAAL